MEISMVIKQVFEAAIMVDLLPHSQIDIFLTVLQADGGTRTAAINAATLGEFLFLFSLHSSSSTFSLPISSSPLALIETQL